jgi:hypothetical protein
MDVFAHTVWAALTARAINKKRGIQAVKVGWTAFWGVFPDLFAFTVPFVVIFITVFSGDASFSDFPRGEGAPLFPLAHILYNYSHSIVIWLVVFFVTWVIYKRPRLELLGWLLHICIDMPTHTEAFFPTPFLFPISDFHFPYGISWATPWFMAANYSLMLLAGIYIFITRKRKN